MKIKKSYSFAFWTSFYICFVLVLVLLLIYFSKGKEVINWVFFFELIGLVFITNFIITQFRIEKFIYQRIKKIYDSVRILDSSDLNKTFITSDMETLTNEVKKFAEQKQLQIKNLHIRENYRREFLGNISHELKTPLFTVQSYLLTLADGALSDKKINKKYLKRANKGVDRLISIVKDLDLISKLESDEFNLHKEEFNMVELVKEVFELLELKAKRKSIKLNLEKFYSEPIVIGDVERFEQVLTNLIVNSIKYGKNGGETQVSFENAPNNKLLVHVKDNGEGIKEEHLTRVFERFYRVDLSRSREQGGSGLGLAIVKHIIEAHNETISVVSEYSKGTIFSFTIEKVKKI